MRTHYRQPFCKRLKSTLLVNIPKVCKVLCKTMQVCDATLAPRIPWSRYVAFTLVVLQKNIHGTCCIAVMQHVSLLHIYFNSIARICRVSANDRWLKATAFPQPTVHRSRAKLSRCYLLRHTFCLHIRCNSYICVNSAMRRITIMGITVL